MSQGDKSVPVWAVFSSFCILITGIREPIMVSISPWNLIAQLLTHFQVFMIIIYVVDYTTYKTYRKISNISRSKSPNLNVPRLVLLLYLTKLLMPGIKLRMKM